MKKSFIISATVMIISFFIFSSCSEPDIPQGYALVYGVTEFTHLQDLTFTDDDAIAIKALLDDKKWIAKLGLNADADMESVVSDVNALAAVMNENDRFIFYYSGHGGPMNLNGGEPDSATNESDEIIVLYGSSSTLYSFSIGTATAEDVLNVTFSDDNLGKLLSRLPTNNKTIIIDACNSGGFVNQAFTYNASPQDYSLNQTTAVFTPSESFRMYMNYSIPESDLPYSEYTFLSAAGEPEDSIESFNLQHGLFTYFFLKSGKADFNLDGYISLIEAWKYTALNIENYYKTTNLIEKYQHMPNIGAFPVDPVLFKAD